jgi:1-acyl-sn-glycerol-3-phosphate acyltransferase
VFPEGGRTEDGKLRPFKDGFFNLAVDAQASVLVGLVDVVAAVRVVAVVVPLARASPMLM